MFEVAKLAGVSHQTVSRVINDSPDVSDATRARVQAAIDQLGYRPSNPARALASRRSRTIGLIAGGLKFFGPISSISSIESMAREHGLFMSVMMVHEALCAQADFDNLCDTFNEQNVDPFIFLTPTDVMFAAACRARVTQPRVIDLLPAEGVSETELLTLAAALESRSEHPLAKAILADAEAKAITPPEVTDFAALPGNGLAAKLDGMDIYAGNAAFIQTKLTLPAALAQQAEKLAAEGKTPLFFGGAGRLLGVIAVADTIKEDSPEAIRQLQNMGIRVVHRIPRPLRRPAFQPAVPVCQTGLYFEQWL